MNPIVVRWARFALGERGGLLLWPSEHLINLTGNETSEMAYRMA